MRISEEDENSQRQSRDQSPPQSWTEKIDHSVAVDFRFPKKARILSRSHFRSLQKGGLRLAGNVVVFNYRLGKTECSKMGITVSRRYGKAHDRNRFKRVIREAFRQFRGLLPKDLEVHVAPRINEPLKTEDVFQDFHTLVTHLCYLSTPNNKTL